MSLLSNKRHLAAAALGILLPLSATLSSAQADQPLNEIVVTAKADQSLLNVLPTSHILGADEIDLVQAKDITSLLNHVSGINITDSGGRGSTTGVFLRGAAISQTIVLIDGVRVGSATLGSAALNSYPIEAIERIEVVKGPLSGIYGADAVGGVIQLFTKSAANSENRGSVSATLGSDSLQEYALSISGGNENNGFYLSAQSEETDGIDRTSIVSGGNDDEDGFEQTSFSLGGNARVSDHTRATLAILQSDNTVEFDNTFGADSGFVTDTETLSASIGLATEVNDNISWQTKLGYNEDDSNTPAFSSEFKTERSSFSTEAAISISAESSLTVGADYYDEEVVSNTSFPETDRDNKGLFALFQARAGAMGFIGNIRYDDNSAYGNETNGSVALDYSINDNTRATASYGTSFVAPSFNSLYFPFFGNPDLLPEESESFELSLRGFSGGYNWRVSAYQTDIENLFSFNPNTFLAANIGSAEIKGIEAEVTKSWADWNFSAVVDILSAEDQDSGVELDDRAQQSIALSASRSWEKLDLRFAVNAESDRFDNRGTELSSYALLDVNANYKLSDHFTIQATVNNLFDKDYTVNLIGANDRFRTEGRQARLKLRYSF